MKDFVHLHAHSTYSILDAWGQPDAIVDRLVDADMGAHALTDHDSTSGHWKFNKAAQDAGIKPLFGIEIRVVDDLEQREEKSEDGKRFYPYHLGLIAADADGYKNLMGLTTLAWQQGIGGRGKYMPVVTWDDINRYKKGLVGTSGCLSGKISRAILGQVDEDWRQVRDQIESCLDPGHFFIEWQNINLDACREVASVLAKEKNAVVTHDVHFPTQEQAESRNIMNSIMRWKKMIENDPMSSECFLASPAEVIEIHQRINNGSTTKKQLYRAMEQTLSVTDMIKVELPQIEMVRFPLPDGYNDQIDLFKDMIREGWNRRGLNRLVKSEKKVYRKRLLYEFDIIVKKDFVDYFLMMADICHFCIDQDILKGPARGSSAGSLIAWVLAITEVNPLEHGLIFERFIDLNRQDLPDVDMDFQDDRREEIHRYLQEKYGEKNVGYIGTFTKFKAKNSLDDVTRVFELPHWVPGKIKPYIPERAHGDVRSDMTLLDSMDAFDEVREVVNQFPDIKKAVMLEGQFRGMGVHPAGFVVASSPIEDVAPIYEQEGKGRVVGLDLYDAASAGLLKIDLLGLSTMTQIARARDAVRKFHNTDINFYDLPLDDEKTMEGFRNVDVLGIFQFGGKATKNTLRQIRPTTFDTLADINTLSRPGSMLAGTSDLYVSIHNGRKKPVSIHPLVDQITADTHNLVLYQEQVLRIMREVGGLDWQTSSEIRKMMSKRMGMEILQQFWDLFVEGAKKKGIDEELAREVWLQTSTFGAYGFNKSHSVSYSMIAYWQMYIKQHYPKEFYYGALTVENDMDKRDLFILEAKQKGISFLPVDPNKSLLSFSLEAEGIRYGLTQIRGVGDKTAHLIIESRPIRSRDDLLSIKGIGAKTADLFEAALDSGGDLFGLDEQSKLLSDCRKSNKAASVLKLRQMADDEHIDTGREYTVAGHIISRNYRQEQKLSVQAKSPDQVGAKSDTVIVYIRDESGESFPVVIPGWLASNKVREIWEGAKHDIYLIRGRLPIHGKFYLANGLANTNWQEANNGQKSTKQARIPF